MRVHVDEHQRNNKNTAGNAGVRLCAVHRAMELWVFTVVAFCTAWNGGGVL